MGEGSGEGVGSVVRWGLAVKWRGWERGWGSQGEGGGGGNIVGKRREGESKGEGGGGGNIVGKRREGEVMVREWVEGTL